MLIREFISQSNKNQIISNFIPYTNPYIVISWKIPSTIMTDMREIRSEIEWSGTVNLNYPTELESNAPYRVSADTSFTIKGWLFPAKGATDGKNIFYVNTNISPVTGFEYI